MTKDYMDLLKGFPLSIEQKERLLELIGNNSGGSENNNEVLKIEQGDGHFRINGISFRVDPFTNDGMYTFQVSSKELYKYVVENNIKSAIFIEMQDGGIVKAELNSTSYVHMQSTVEDPGFVGFAFVGFYNGGIWRVDICDYD